VSPSEFISHDPALAKGFIIRVTLTSGYYFIIKACSIWPMVHTNTWSVCNMVTNTEGLHRYQREEYTSLPEFLYYILKIIMKMRRKLC